MTEHHSKVEMRGVRFVSRTATQICDEEPSEKNPYLAESCRCHGYDIIELARKRSFVDVFYLLFRGELPTTEQSRLLETLMIAFINPGPRHPATQAAMYTGVGKTYSSHILPIALSVMGGAHLGGAEVADAMRFIKKNSGKESQELVADLLAGAEERDGDIHIAPGFGNRFGGIDPLPEKIASVLLEMPASGEALQWCASFAADLRKYNMGWLATGVVAAAFCDLGFSFLSGAGLFQFICAPGLLAHGLELASPHKSVNAMPFLDKEHYVIDPEAKKRKG